MSHDEQELMSRALRERSETMAGSSVSLEEVRRGARGIRRRRRATGGVVAAAVLAVTLPYGLSHVDLVSGSPPVAGTSTPSPSTGSSPSPGPSPRVTDPSPGALTPAQDARVSVPRSPARGAAPRIPYLQGTTVHQPGGASDELPARYSGLTPWGEGWVAARSVPQADNRVDLLDGGNQVVAGFRGDYDLAVAHDRRTVAWSAVVGGRLALRTLATDGVDRQPGTIRLPALVNGLQPIGFVGPGRVIYTSTGGTSGAGVTTAGGGTREIPGVIQVGGAYEPRSLATVRLSDNGSQTCWGVMYVGATAAQDQVRWRTCGHSLGDFSPDGRFVLAGSPDHVGIDDSQAVVLQATTGAPVATFTLGGATSGTFYSVAWEDADHVLAQVRTDGPWRLLRLGVDGSVEAATDPLADGAGPNPGDPPVTFLAAP